MSCEVESQYQGKYNLCVQDDISNTASSDTGDNLKEKQEDLDQELKCGHITESVTRIPNSNNNYLEDTSHVKSGSVKTQESISGKKVLLKNKFRNKDTISRCERVGHDSMSVVPPIEKKQERQITLPDRPSLWCVDPDCCDDHDDDDDDRLTFGDRKELSFSLDDTDHGDGKVLPSVDQAKQIVQDTLKLCWMSKKCTSSQDDQELMREGIDNTIAKKYDQESRSIPKYCDQDKSINVQETSIQPDLVHGSKTLSLKCQREKCDLSVSAALREDDKQEVNAASNSPVYLEFDSNLTKLMLQRNHSEKCRDDPDLEKETNNVLGEEEKNFPARGEEASTPSEERTSTSLGEKIYNLSGENITPPGEKASPPLDVEIPDPLEEEICPPSGRSLAVCLFSKKPDIPLLLSESEVSIKQENVKPTSTDMCEMKSNETDSGQSREVTAVLKDDLSCEEDDSDECSASSDGDLVHSDQDVLTGVSTRKSVACQTSFSDNDFRETTTVTKSVQTKQKLLVINKNGKVSRATQTHCQLKLHASGNHKGVRYSRSKSLQRTEGEGEECKVKRRLRKTSDGCLQDLSSSCVEAELSEQERMFLTDDSPEMQVVVNSSTPVLVRRKTSIRQTPRKDCFAQTNGALQHVRCGFKVDENQNIETSDDTLHGNQNCLHTCQVKSSGNQKTTNSILKERNSINDGHNDNTQSSQKQSIIISPEMSRTWHGSSGTTLLRPAPRMGLGMVSSESTPYFSHKRYATVSGHSMAELPGELCRGFPYISRSLLDAMHKRYYSNYSPHQCSMFPTNPVVDSTAHALPAPIVVPLVQPPNRLDLKVEDSDSISSVTTSVQSSPKSHHVETRETTPDTTPTLQKKLNESIRERREAEIEAVEACKWLRAAGFPQYAQMYEDGQFPIDISVVEKDHDFLDRDSIQSLFRRLNTLNRCTALKIEAQPRKTNEETDDDDYCALSSRWEFQQNIQRWSRKDLDLDQSHVTVKSSSSHDSLLTDQDSSSPADDSPVLDSKMPHLGYATVQRKNSTPTESSFIMSPRLRRAASDKIKSAKNLLRKVESFKTKRNKKFSKNIVEISGPVVADKADMQAKIQHMNCVDISPTSEVPARTFGEDKTDENCPVLDESSPVSPISPKSSASTKCPLTPVTPNSPVVPVSPKSPVVPVSPKSPVVPMSPKSPVVTEFPKMPHISPALPHKVQSDNSSKSVQESQTKSQLNDSSLSEFYMAHRELLQSFKTADSYIHNRVRRNNSDMNLMEIFFLPQDHKPGSFPKRLQNGYIDTCDGHGINYRTGSFSFSREKSDELTPLPISPKSGKKSIRLSMYDNLGDHASHGRDVSGNKDLLNVSVQTKCSDHLNCSEVTNVSQLSEISSNISQLSTCSEHSSVVSNSERSSLVSHSEQSSIVSPAYVLRERSLSCSGCVNQSTEVSLNGDRRKEEKEPLDKELAAAQQELDAILHQLFENINGLSETINSRSDESVISKKENSYASLNVSQCASVDESMITDQDMEGENDASSNMSSPYSDQDIPGEELSPDDSMEHVENTERRERRDSGVGSSLTRTSSDRKRKRIRWHSFQKCHRPSLNSRDLQVDSLSVRKLMVLRKLSLLKLTAIMEKYSPTNRTGWNWSMPRFMKRNKSPDFTEKNVFGVPLHVVLQRTGQALPQCMLYAMRYLRKTANDALGIFRKSGVRSRIQKLRNDLEAHPEEVDFEELQAYDVADLLKQYFRELPECLLTNKLSETFITIFTHVPVGLRLEAIQATIVLLPDENRETLQSLLLFLSDISQHSSEHQMTASNLAVCFAPSLFNMGGLRFNSTSSPKRNRKNLGIPEARELQEQKAAHECLTFMITESKKIFMIPSWVFSKMPLSSIEGTEPMPFEEFCRVPNHDGPDFKSYGEECIQTLLKESHEKNRGWVLTLSVSGIEIFYKKPTDSNPLREWKCCVEVEAPPVEVLNRILHERQVWDEDLLNWSVVVQLDQHTDVFQYTINSMAPHPTRHYCILRYWRTDLVKGACAMISASVDHPDITEVQGVQAIEFMSHFLMEPCGSGKTRITHLTRTDTRGRSPEWYNKSYGYLCANYMDRIRESFHQQADLPETDV